MKKLYFGRIRRSGIIAEHSVCFIYIEARIYVVHKIILRRFERLLSVHIVGERCAVLDERNFTFCIGAEIGIGETSDLFGSGDVPDTR